MKRIISILFAAVLLLPVSCQQETVEVFASFETDRETYGPMEPVVIETMEIVSE